ncbi:MAG: STAS domain-containing protein [Candidatus Omnitrophica bacterium]|nr:STAS domain-containing protein [Candidatus Omnitrophota bacterium]MDD5672113.1 STAS domain-containing protein [Candidatus Omnitrophota bacterium]
MAYRLRAKMGVNVLRFPSDLNAGEMVKMKNYLARLIKKNRKKLLLDLSQTRHVELAGVGILVDRLRSVRAQKGDIKFCNMRPEVERVLDMIGLGSLIETFHSEEEAIQSFAP